MACLPQVTIDQITCLINKILAARLPQQLSSVTTCLVVTVGGTWGNIGDIIQNIKWFDAVQTPQVYYTNQYLNTVTGLYVTGVNNTNTKPCETLSKCCGNIEFANTTTTVVHDCGDYYRNISFDIRISADSGNIISSHADGIYAKLSPYDSTTTIVANTIDGADTLRYTIAGGGSAAQNRGAFIDINGNENGGAPGGINLALGDAAGATLDLGYGGSAASHVRAYANSTLQWQTTNNFAFEFKNGANESTGAGNGAIGAGNCPAVTPTAVYKWLKVALSDGSTGYIPVWK